MEEEEHHGGRNLINFSNMLLIRARQTRHGCCNYSIVSLHLEQQMSCRLGMNIHIVVRLHRHTAHIFMMGYFRQWIHLHRLRFRTY